MGLRGSGLCEQDPGRSDFQEPYFHFVSYNKCFSSAEWYCMNYSLKEVI